LYRQIFFFSLSLHENLRNQGADMKLILSFVLIPIVMSMSAQADETRLPLGHEQFANRYNSELYASTGATVQIDHNGDGIWDKGPDNRAAQGVSSGQPMHLRLTLPSGCTGNLYVNRGGRTEGRSFAEQLRNCRQIQADNPDDNEDNDIPDEQAPLQQGDNNPDPNTDDNNDESEGKEKTNNKQARHPQKAGID
jgi:hypothetical protein